MLRVVGCLIGMSFACMVQAGPELSGTPQELSQYLLDQKQIVSLSAMAQEVVEVDTAIVALSVHTKHSQLDRALTDNERVRREIRQSLQGAGIEEASIQASRFSSTPNYSWYKDKPSSYEISNEIKVTISDETQLRAIAGLVDTRKEVTLGATEFKDSSEEANELKVLQRALAKVEQKKALYERELGIKLVPVRVLEQHVYAQPVMRQRASQQEMMTTVDTFAASAPPSADFGAITYRANAVVEYRLQ